MMGNKPIKKLTKPFPLDVKQLLGGDINRLRYIRRYGTSLVMHPENVAEHSYYVMFYSHALATYATCLGKTIDYQKMFVRGLLHDVDEARSGDFQRPFKYSSQNMLEAINEASAVQMSHMISQIYNNDALVWAMSEFWKNAKDGTLEGVIVELADFLCVVSYLWQESRSTSQSMTMHYETMDDFIAHFRTERFDLFRAIIDDVEAIVASMRKKRKKGKK